MIDTQKIFSVQEDNFQEIALEIFDFQWKNVEVYRKYCHLLEKSPSNVHTIKDIPFLPIEFFKLYKIIRKDAKETKIFTSSGTTSSTTSKHFVEDLSIYEKSFSKSFEYFYGNMQKYTIFALLPSYLEREGSSLVYMVDYMIKKSTDKQSDFFLKDLDRLVFNIQKAQQEGKKIILIGVSFALLDLASQYNLNLEDVIVMETGGMKGRKKEIVREELHKILKESFNISSVHSEYGMTELLSQAYSFSQGIFRLSPWMRVLVRDTQDAFEYVDFGQTGGLNVIDLANVNSCSFISTADLAKSYSDGTFEVLGRFDNSDIRGCSLLIN